MRRKVAIILAYLENNLGDDIFVQLLCLRYPDVDFFVALPNQVNNSLKSISNLSFSKEMKKFDSDFGKNDVSKSAKKYFNKFDACVAIGGSIFMQNSNMWRSQVLRFKNRLGLSKRLYVIGANFGPFNDNSFLTEYANLFSRTEDICFRDMDSASYFPMISTVRWAPDVLLTYNKCPREEKNQVIISVIDCSWGGRPKDQFVELRKHKDIYEQRLFEVCKKFSEMGYSICLMAFCDKQKDREAAERVLALCLDNGINNVHTFSYVGDIESAVNEIAESKYVIATRFHSMILGWLYDKPTYPIIYDHKQRTVIKDSEFNNNFCYLHEIDRISVDDIISSLLNYKGFACGDYIKAAQNQFKGLDIFLGRNQ